MDHKKDSHFFFGIQVKDFVSSDDTITIAALVAVQHDTRGRVLDLGFDRIDVHQRIVSLY